MGFEPDEAIKAAKRFIALAEHAKKADAEERRIWNEWSAARKIEKHTAQPAWHKNNPRAGIHRAAAKRASMDLTRALADFRRS